MKDYYKILRITETASAGDVAAAYQSMVAQAHNGIMQLHSMEDINEAYECLSDGGRRAAYNLQLAGYRQQPIQQQPITCKDHKAAKRALIYVFLAGFAVPFLLPYSPTFGHLADSLIGGAAACLLALPYLLAVWMRHPNKQLFLLATMVLPLLGVKVLIAGWLCSILLLASGKTPGK